MTVQFFRKMSQDYEGKDAGGLRVVEGFETLWNTRVVDTTN